MNGDDKKYLETRLTKLETQFHERWISHTNGAKERAKTYCNKFEDMKKELKHIFDRLTTLPCSTNIEKISNIEKDVKSIVDNHLNHLNSRITGLYFTMIGSISLLVITVIIKYLSKL